MGEVYVEVDSEVSSQDYQTESNPIEAWLPITKSRKGNAYTSSFHLICSGIGLQALSLPIAFAALGWVWGILSLSLAFAWQLYTIWLLVHLHEPVAGTRYSRYLRLSMAAFGEKLGKLLAIFPVMYLSGGTCVLLIINGGKTMELFYQTMCENGPPLCNPKAFTGAECFLVFTCLAIAVALFCPNLNSVAGVSFIGAITAVGYCTLIWVLSVSKGRPDSVPYASSMVTSSAMGRFRGVLTALGIIAIAFRGHNVVLEIQGTLPSNPKHPSNEPMWKGVKVSYLIISLCLFPLAIGGYWAYGNRIPTGCGFLSAFSVLNKRNTSKFVKGFIYLLIVISCLCSFQIYAMPFFDNLEFIYVGKKNKQCPRWLRFGLRFFFGGLTFFIAMALPFLGSLAALLGGITLPLTLAYPCFMWLTIMKPRPNSAMWWSNLCLGCLGILLSVLLVVTAVWNLVVNGFDANFFNPH
ncbi:lysine histidine transporter-like 8 [Rhododendron vialii]|uniref:lysine histidine transporter-like 8 n=1 Tax=Rhododendron vialii TaxID=182163 RepID=UPI00265FCF22|nr:lysine histidine transporter-like 8 [Rhododendron vialii]